MHENDGRKGYLINQSGACTAQFPSLRLLDPLEAQKKRCGFVLAWGSYFGNDLCLRRSVGRSRLSFFPSFWGRKKVEKGEEKAPSSVRREKVSSWHCRLACTSKGKAKQGTTTTGDA